MKQTFAWFLAFMVLFSVGSLVFSREEEVPWTNPYADVTEDLWSYQYITELNKAGILPDAAAFQPEAEATRGELIVALFNMDSIVFAEQKKERERAQKGQALAPSFYDVSPDSELYEPVAWAYRNGIVSGTTSTTFSPNDSLTREQVCTLLARFGSLEGVQLARVVEPDQFKDSIYVSEYARSGVTACQMAGIIKGYANGFLYPSQVMSKQECAATLYRIYLAATSTLPEGTETVDLTAGAYDSLYDSYTDIPFTALVPAGAEAPQGYFDRTVFIGDSISLMLKAYCASTGALGQAQFLCAGSMSATNMLTGQILPEYPAGSGEKPPIQQSVAATGASVVYIMLGMDNMGYLGTDRALSDLTKIVANIKEAAPNVTIVMQSVTPMADSSTSYSQTLNNDVIDEYNTKLQALCQEQRWYYLNVSEVFKNENGFLIKDYCSDYGKMGMHFNYKGTAVWVDYLKTHVPADLLADLGLA